MKHFAAMSGLNKTRRTSRCEKIGFFNLVDQNPAMQNESLTRLSSDVYPDGGNPSFCVG